MEKGQYIRDIGSADAVAGLFVIAEAAQQQSKNGPYWRLTLRDSSGDMEAKIWSPLSLEYSALAAGQCAWVEGRSSLFRDQVQLTVEVFRLTAPEEMAHLPLAALLPASPRMPEDMEEELFDFCREEFTYAPWRKLVFSVLETEDIRDRLRLSPAAKGVHHAYVGGLLEHTLGVFHLARRIADQYLELDRQTLLAGAIFHDIGKIAEFSGGLANDYTDAGRLLGHMELGLELLAPYLKKSTLDPDLVRHLKHLILSHHGTPEFGAARLPQTAEALALHYADNLDAKMAQCRSLFNDVPEDAQVWSPYQPTLGRHMHRAVKTPESASGKKHQQQKAVLHECLSLLKV